MLVKLTSDGRRRGKKASHGTKRGEREKVCEEKKKEIFKNEKKERSHIIISTFFK